MKHYKDTQNNLHALDDASFEHLLPEGFVEITEQEADAITLSKIPVPTLAQAQTAKWEAIKAERERRTQYMGYTTANKWFHSDTFSRTQQMGLVMYGANLPAGIPWKTMDGSTITMTPALALQVFSAAATSDITTFSVAESKKAAMLALADPKNYDVLVGWPKGYGEV